ncbi:MAG TPA: hypothetical protein VHS99_10090 [Chloroflexota bacterium]|nr:hypothetical protein [Chloroflexota bacterium]
MSRARLERFATPAGWAPAMRNASGGLEPEAVIAGWEPGIPGLVEGYGRPVFALGNPEARARIWIQCDAAGSPNVLAFVAAGIMEALAGGAPNRYRQLLLGRTRVAVVPPVPPAVASGGVGEGTGGWPADGDRLAEVPPVLDAGWLGVSPGLTAAMDAFGPTLVIHLQDWTGWGSAGRSDASLGGSVDGAGGALAGAGLRLVESFYVDPDLHRALGEERARRTWLGRPTALARALAEHPDGRVGAFAGRHVARLGYRLFDLTLERRVAQHDPSWPAVVRLAPSRYLPRWEWRRLGAASLGEIALARYGALALCGQLFDNPAAERAGQALAFAEAVAINRLGLAEATT